MAKKRDRLPPDRRCGTCAWWDPTDDDGTTDATGRCLLNPPTLICVMAQPGPDKPLRSEVESCWPETTARDACQYHATPEEVVEAYEDEIDEDEDDEG